MKTSEIWATAFTVLVTVVGAQAEIAKDTVNAIFASATADSIDLRAIPSIDLDAVLGDIARLYAKHDNAKVKKRKAETSKIIPRGPADIIDVHAHCVPDWYRDIVPKTGGNPTPLWNVTGHLSFLESQGISRAILAFSSPGANVYPGDEAATIALARLINEQSAAYAQAYPAQITFYAVVPLPYTLAAIKEATYALEELGAAGIALYSNFEGHYLGSPSFTSFFTTMNDRGSGQIIYIHPTTPYLRVNGTLVEANPTIYPSGNIEFYFETARTLSDLAVTQTLLNFTNINYIIPHVGGAFPSVADRLVKSYPAIYNATMNALQTRFYWDSAGPTYFHQVGGLLAYDVPTTQLLFGTDYPYAPGFTYGPSLLGIEQSRFVGDVDRDGIWRENAERLFGDRLP